MRISSLGFHFKRPGLSWRVSLIARITRTKSLRTVKGGEREKKGGLSATSPHLSTKVTSRQWASQRSLGVLMVLTPDLEF